MFIPFSLDLQWSCVEVPDLISAYEEVGSRRQDFDNPTIRKAEIWASISVELSQQGYERSGEKVEQSQDKASSLAKGFAHGSLSLHPWQIEMDFVISADRHLAVFTGLAYKDDINGCF